MRYRIMAIKYGYMEVDVPDNNEKEALQLAENAPDTQYDWTKPYDHKIVESYTSGSSKKVVLIKGANAALKCGEPAVVYTMDDQILKTSPCGHIQCVWRAGLYRDQTYSIPHL